MKRTVTLFITLLLAPLATLLATEEITNSIGMKLLRIETGKFCHGSRHAAGGLLDDEARGEVR